MYVIFLKSIVVISRYENGQTTILTSFLIEYAKFFNVSCDYIMGRIDEKIPLDKRKEVLLLADGSHILWVIGKRISDYYKITKDTKNILEIHYDGGNENGKTPY